MAVYEKILFFSKYSEACKHPFQFIQQNKLDIIPICVDSQEIRERLNGEQFSIRNVPTLLVSFDDGRRQLYEVGKVMIWLQQYFTPQPNFNPQQTLPQPTQSSPQNVDIIEELKEEVEDSDIDYIEDNVGGITHTPEKKPSLLQQKATSLKNLAAQMERQRQETLGYDDKKLPYH